MKQPTFYEALASVEFLKEFSRTRMPLGMGTERKPCDIMFDLLQHVEDLLLEQVQERLKREVRPSKEAEMTSRCGL